MTKTTTVTVLDVEKYNNDWMPENLADALSWLQEKISGIPEEFRNSAKIEVDSVTDYDWHTPSIKISYSRPMTAEEMAEEAAAEEERTLRFLRRAEQEAEVLRARLAGRAA